MIEHASINLQYEKSEIEIWLSIIHEFSIGIILCHACFSSMLVQCSIALLVSVCYILEGMLNLQVKDCICRLVQSGVDSGARLLLDGRNIVVHCLFLSFIR